MYHVSAQGADERMINVHYYYYFPAEDGKAFPPGKMSATTLSKSSTLRSDDVGV